MESHKKNWTQRFLHKVEVIGNKLPHPVVVFMILAIILAFISEILYRLGITVTYFDARANQEVTVQAVSLLNGAGLNHVFTHATQNFANFAPIATVLVAMLGVGLAEGSGLIGTALHKLISKVPKSLLTMVVVFAGIISNIASDAGYVVVIPLGAIVFAGAKRHPIAGLAAAFAGVSGGFSANLLFGPTDALLTGITNAAIESVGINYTASVTGNWYFLFISTFILTVVGAWVTEKIIEPHLGEYTESFTETEHQARQLTVLEEKGLKYAGISLFITLILLLILMIPQWSPFRMLDDNTGKYTLQNFLNNGIIFLSMILFAIPGYVYGRITKTINNSNEFVEKMSDSMKTMSSFIVLCFFASQVINYFSYTNIGLIIASSGANFLEKIGVTGIPLILAFILLTAFINLFIGSASAKWAILAPIFVPIFFNLGLTPELTQIAYRIADSSTNIISPLMNYFAMVVIFMQKYDKKSGLGTLSSVMLPYSIFFLIFWSILLIIWYILNLPLGPGVSIHL